jgi:adenylate cyclase
MPEPRAKFDTAPLHAWLIEAGLAGVTLADQLDGFSRRLVEAGVPLARGYASFATLHPLLWASGITWQGGRIVDAIDLRYGYEREAAWRDSPFRTMIETRARRMRRRLGNGAALDYPVLREFRDAGLTDWLALRYAFGWTVEQAQVGELGAIFSWATDRPGGWSDADLGVLEELSGTFALAIKATVGQRATHDLLATYLGRDAAERVFVGQVQRGSVERRAAFILYADLRGFTDFTETAAPEEVTRRLNDVFECIGTPVRDAGGEILKFLGDGLLAVFLPGDRADADVATAVLTAARGILDRIQRLNTEERKAGNPALALDIALHRGAVTYGNVGTADRLDFTVIGPAVNEASRLEGLCKEVGRHLLISESFVQAAPALRMQLRSLGHHRLRGVREAREVFAGD